MMILYVSNCTCIVQRLPSHAQGSRLSLQGSRTEHADVWKNRKMEMRL